MLPVFRLSDFFGYSLEKSAYLESSGHPAAVIDSMAQQARVFAFSCRIVKQSTLKVKCPIRMAPRHSAWRRNCETLSTVLLNVVEQLV